MLRKRCIRNCSNKQPPRVREVPDIARNWGASREPSAASRGHPIQVGHRRDPSVRVDYLRVDRKVYEAGWPPLTGQQTAHGTEFDSTPPRIPPMHLRTCTAAIAILFLPSLASAQANPVATAFRDNAKEAAKNLVAAAEELDAAKYGFKPTPPQMSFGRSDSRRPGRFQAHRVASILWRHQHDTCGNHDRDNGGLCRSLQPDGDLSPPQRQASADSQKTGAVAAAARERGFRDLRSRSRLLSPNRP